MYIYTYIHKFYYECVSLYVCTYMCIYVYIIGTGGTSDELSPVQVDPLDGLRITQISACSTHSSVIDG